MVIFFGQFSQISRSKRSLSCLYHSDTVRDSTVNCSYDPLHYVLLFSSGDNGWQLKILHSRGNGDVTPIEFYSYRLIVRSAVSYLHLCGRLFHQYLADIFAKVGQLRFNNIKCNQQKIRVDLHSELADAVSAGDINPGEFG